MPHLDGYVNSQETCSHIGNKYFVHNHALYVARYITPESSSRRTALPFDEVICEDCGQRLQLLWVEKPISPCDHKDLYNWQRYFDGSKESIRGQCRNCGAWIFYSLTWTSNGDPAKEWPVNAK